MATIHDEFADFVYTIQRKSGGMATVKIYWRCDIDPCATYEISSKGALAYAREMIKRLENEPVPDGLHDRALQSAKSCRALGCDAAAAEMEGFASRHAPNSDPIEIVRTEGTETMNTYLINVLLTNGDIFARTYETPKLAAAEFFKLTNNPLVVFASLHDENDAELAVIDHSAKV